MNNELTNDVNDINKEIANDINNETINNNLLENKEEKKSEVKYEVSDVNLLVAYIKKNQDKILKNKFSIPAFIFNGYYLLYRKIYGLGFLICFITSLLLMAYTYFKNNIILYITVMLMFIISILLGLFTNKNYLEKCYKEITKIKKINKSEEELIKKCNKKGGTSIIKMILIVILIFIITNIINSIIFPIIKNNTKQEEKNNNTVEVNPIDVQLQKYNGYLLHDTSININNEFSITIPTTFKASMMNSDYAIDYEYSDQLNSCGFSLKGVENYTSSNKLIQEMAEYNNVIDIKTNTINNIKWDSFISTTSLETTYIHATTKNNKVYLFEYKINNEDNNKVCTNYYNNILKTVKLK
ncbi:MAG: DUF2628 domain-containing protein [Bacilli bacterium]|nr:DUF2628 domain-containing protein [Bacilli bacterium]